MHLFENIWSFDDVSVTLRSGDKGIDLDGKIKLLPVIGVSEVDTKIRLKIQAKNQAENVGLKDESRLAARVDDGEIEFFVTTSHFMDQAQIYAIVAPGQAHLGEGSDHAPGSIDID